MLETLRVEQWLYQVLTQDSALAGLVGGRVYGYFAPPDAAMPYVIYANAAGRDVRGVGPTRFMTRLRYQVKAVGRGGSFAALGAIADRIDALLHGAAGVVVGDVVILACLRDEPIEYVEVNDGIQYRYLGGWYQIDTA